MKRFCMLLLGLWLLILGQTVYARDNESYILEQSFYSDKTDTLSYSDVKSLVFTPYHGLLTGGYSKGAYWIKLSVQANMQDLVLRVRPAYLNEITLYDPASPHGPKLSGSNFPIDDADVEAVSLNFILPPSTTNREIYLRVKSLSSYLVYVEVMPLTDFKRLERTDNLIYAGYVVLTLILALWLFMTWLMNRERVIGAFTLQQSFAFIHAFIKIGFARALLDRYVSDELILDVSNLNTVFYPFVALVVNRLLLQEYGLKPVFKFVFNALTLGSLSVIGLFLSGYEVLAININAILVLAMMLWFLVCVLWGTDSTKALETANAVQLNVLRIFYGFNLLVWLIAILPLLGIISTGTVALHSLFVYNIMSSLVFFVLLQYRARWLLRHEVARASTLKAEAIQERQRREEQSMLMAMLSHEIKTPLSVLKLVMDAKVAGSDLEGHANRAVGNINFIVNRCLQLGKLDAKAIQINRSAFEAQQFFEEILEDYQGVNRFETTIPKELQLSTDREILRVIMSNLLENAIKYGASDRPVHVDMVSLRKNETSGVQITVRNEVGPLGVPDADQVFKKYYRNTQATKVAGSGLGLFLVHELASVVGGRVAYATEEKEVVFSVWIPH
ncbi:MAG: sensor histidine kinase [Fluviibacter sp.]